MPDKEGYPTVSELHKVKNWDLIKGDVKEMIDYIKLIWWMPDWGFKLSGKRVLKLELHTGGWSGNEEIIGVLKNHKNKSWLFWAQYWKLHRVGGHYYFRIPLKSHKN